MIVLGALLAVAAAGFFRYGWKNRAKPDAPQAPTPVTAVVIGLAFAGCAYHLFAYALPPAWLPLVVPVARWWIVPSVAVVAVVGSFLADRIERR